MSIGGFYIGDIAFVGLLLIFLFAVTHKWSDFDLEMFGYYFGTPEEIERTKRNQAGDLDWHKVIVAIIIVVAVIAAIVAY